MNLFSLKTCHWWRGHGMSEDVLKSYKCSAFSSWHLFCFVWVGGQYITNHYIYYSEFFFMAWMIIINLQRKIFTSVQFFIWYMNLWAGCGLLWFILHHSHCWSVLLIIYVNSTPTLAIHTGLNFWCVKYYNTSFRKLYKTWLTAFVLTDCCCLPTTDWLFWECLLATFFNAPVLAFGSLWSC